MRSGLFAIVCMGLLVGLAADEGDKGKAPGPVRLPENWGESVTIKDLTDEIDESAARMGQNLKKASDFDKFLKSVRAEGHLIAVLSELVERHPDAGGWRGAAETIQEQGLIVAKAAEAKGVKNFRTAQDAHKKIVELLKKKDPGGSSNGDGGDPTEWATLGALSDVMKRVEPSYKYIRGKMNESAFKRDAETIRHHAAMLYIYGQISPAFRPKELDMPKLSGDMSSASLDMLNAIKSQDFEKANEANTAINNSCNECHKVKRFAKKGSDFDF